MYIVEFLSGKNVCNIEIYVASKTTNLLYNAILIVQDKKTCD